MNTRSLLAAGAAIIAALIAWWPNEPQAINIEKTADRIKQALPQAAEQIAFPTAHGEPEPERTAEPDEELVQTHEELTWKDTARERGELMADTPSQVRQLAWNVIRRYQSPDVTRLKAYPGDKTWMPEAPAIDVEEIELSDVYYVMAVPREVSPYDYRVAVWAHKGSNQIAASVVIWAQDGVAAAQGRIAYPIGEGPRDAIPLLRLEHAVQLVNATVLKVDRIFTWGVNPEQWMYRFETDQGVRFVTQVPVMVWHSLDAWYVFAEAMEADQPDRQITRE